MKAIFLIAIVFSCTQIVASNWASNSSVKLAEPAKVSEIKHIETSFRFIRGHKQGQNVTVQWGMNDNSGVSSFTIENTYEDPNDPYSVWQTIGVLPCTNSPIFKFTDSPQLPGSLSYRIIAVLNDNRTIVSAIYTTEIP
ncbi:MAG: hypothetical protein ABIR78_11735 [Ferruginibacter sp.]